MASVCIICRSQEAEGDDCGAEQLDRSNLLPCHT